MNAPERIWAKGNTIDYDLTRWSISRWNGDTEYIRADLLPQWQPIETAPKDGTYVIGLFNDIVAQMKWSNGGGSHLYHWMALGRWTPIDPTYWMPLPTPPHPTARHST